MTLCLASNWPSTPARNILILHSIYAMRESMTKNVFHQFDYIMSRCLHNCDFSVIKISSCWSILHAMSLYSLLIERCEAKGNDGSVLWLHKNVNPSITIVHVWDLKRVHFLSIKFLSQIFNFYYKKKKILKTIATC